MLSFYSRPVLLALFKVYAGKMLLRYGTSTIAPIATMGGVVVLFGMAAACGSLRTIPLLTGLEWIALLFCGTLGGAGVLLLWSWAIEYASAGRIAVFVTATPISAAIVGALVLPEPITLQLVSGTGLIVAGIYLVHQSGSGAPVSKRAFRS